MHKRAASTVGVMKLIDLGWL